MIALDTRHVNHANGTTEQGNARCNHFRHRLRPALRNSARTVSDAFATFEQISNHRVMLETLEFHIGEQMRVFIVQVNHKTDVNLIIIKVINERTATGIAAQRPTHCVGDRPFFVLGRINFPDLFHA